MIRLGHIDYCNCLPVHHLLLDAGAAPDVRVVTGVPATLNAALADGRIDVAPCSSIEYARHAGRYRVLPDLAIGSCGAVGSILLETTVPPAELGGRDVAVPTASATSVVLLRAVLERRLGVAARLRWFAQEDGSDPIAAGAAATLWIGDPALRRRVPAGRAVHDLGREWTAWTGLPFVFAVWQTPLGSEHDAELGRLHAALLRSRAAFADRARELAERHAPRHGLTPERLLAYWGALRYTLDARAQHGLQRFFQLAAELGAAPAVDDLRFVPPAAS